MIKNQVKQYIADNYSKLYNLALSITCDKNRADDLLGSVIHQLLEMKKLDGLEDAYKKNLFVYIFVVMKNQKKNPDSRYNKQFNSYKTKYLCFQWDDEELECQFDNYNNFWKVDNAEILQKIYNYIDSEEFHNTFNLEVDYFYCRTLWNMYYRPELQYDVNEIKKLNPEQIEQIRKTSFRKMGDKTNIDYRSINKTINVVNEKIKKYLNERRKV